VFILYRDGATGIYQTKDVNTREEATLLEPYVPFASANDAHVLSNHLNGHPLWKKGSCTVCHPKIRPAPPTSVAESDYDIAERARVAKLNRNIDAARKRLLKSGA
jgi:hypothetical protein